MFVAHFDFADNTENGRIIVIDAEGEVSAIMSVPGPEITGVCLTPDEKYLLITEGSSNSLKRSINSIARTQYYFGHFVL